MSLYLSLEIFILRICFARPKSLISNSFDSSFFNLLIFFKLDPRTTYPSDCFILGLLQLTMNFTSICSKCNFSAATKLKTCITIRVLLDCTLTYSTRLSYM
uniref:Uncharacterized protein n=1 Tax=Opuntia streptacantha TaxID=393608 RepID=A0A7C8Z8I6_OPUST